VAEPQLRTSVRQSSSAAAPASLGRPYPLGLRQASICCPTAAPPPRATRCPSGPPPSGGWSAEPMDTFVSALQPGTVPRQWLTRSPARWQHRQRQRPSAIPEGMVGDAG
jgi:hypothetical protein